MQMQATGRRAATRSEAGRWSRSAGVLALAGFVISSGEPIRTAGSTDVQDRRTMPGTPPSSDLFSPVVTAGGFIFVSGLVAQGAPNRAIEGDITAQTADVLARLEASLVSAGSSLAQALSVNVYLRDAADFAAMNAAYARAFGDRPPARTTVVTVLPAGALVAMSAIAVPDGTVREVLHPAGWARSSRPYSFIVRANDFVFLSGLVSRRPTDDQPVIGSAELQTKTILDNAGVLLRTAGLDYSDVVSARVFISDGSLFEGMNQEYGRVFVEAPPARATAVAALMSHDARVEITFVATSLPREVLGTPVSPSLPLSAAVRAGRFTFLSGVLDNTAANADDVTGQTTEVLTRIRRTLDTAGLTFADVVENTVYVADWWTQARMAQTYRQFFTKPDAPGQAPPSAGIVVGTGLVARSALIEMMMTAYR